MSGKSVGIAAAVVVVAFLAAFGIGKASSGGDNKEQAAAPSPVQAFKASSTAPQFASYQSTAAVPAPKKEKAKKKAKKKASGGSSGGGGGGSSPPPASGGSD